MLTLPAVSLEYLYVRGIKAFDASSPDHAVNPTTLPIQMAAVARGADPIEANWVSAQWVDSTTARILTGTGGALHPAIGTYDVWVRVTGAVEQPERRIGLLQVT